MEGEKKTIQTINQDSSYSDGIQAKYLPNVRQTHYGYTNLFIFLNIKLPFFVIVVSEKIVWFRFYYIKTTSEILILSYKGVFKSFHIGCLERELQMVQLSATRCSCIAFCESVKWVLPP
jgi:hypothetical protein